MAKSPTPFNRRVNNLIANLRSLPEDHSRAIFRPTRSADDLMDTLIERFQLQQENPAKTIMTHWATVIGPHYADRCCPQTILENSRLVIAVNNPTLRAQLMMDAQRILQRIQQLPGCQKIQTIAWR